MNNNFEISKLTSLQNSTSFYVKYSLNMHQDISIARGKNILENDLMSSINEAHKNTAFKGNV